MSSAHDFEQNNDLDALSSEELEEQAFGPDPKRKRRRRRRSPRREKPAPPAPEAAPVIVTQFCYACGDEVDARAEVCPHCGVRQPDLPARRSLMRSRRPKAKGTATLLALTLGGVGGHRFYVGQWKTGLAMLLFSWTMLPFLLGVVDFVRLAYMSDRRFAGLYDGGAGRPLLAPSQPVLPTGVVSGPRAIAPASVSSVPSEA